MLALWNTAAVLVLLSLAAVVQSRSFEAATSIDLSRPLAKRPIIVPLKARHGVRARGLLRNGTLPIHGAVREVGYFYTNLQVGNPSRTFSVIIDTGSTITYVPCVGCKHCGKHQDEAFNPDDSSSAVRLTCNHPKCNCGTPSCQCSNNQCYYSRTYAERSSSEGWMIEDDYFFPDNQTAVKVVFGCENGETGEIFKQMADGIMGMGNNHNAFQSQLVANGVMEDTFALCFGFPQGGVMFLGDVPLPPGHKTVYTPLISGLHLHYYNVKLRYITVNTERMPVDQNVFNVGYGVVLDSGTTFTYLPTTAFRIMSEAITKYAVSKGLIQIPGADPQYKDICFKNAPEKMEDLEEVFPPAEFVFGGDAKLRLTPMRYLFMMRPTEFCLGLFDNGGSGTLIGGVTVRNVVVQYDRRNKRVGFTEANCENLWSATSNSETASPSSSPFVTTPSRYETRRGGYGSEQATIMVVILLIISVGVLLVELLYFKGENVFDAADAFRQWRRRHFNKRAAKDSTELTTLTVKDTGSVSTG